MNITGKKLGSFFTWWWRGLSSVCGVNQSRARLLDLTPAGLALVDPVNRERHVLDVNRADVLASLNSTRNYLLAPPEAILNTAIPDSRQGQPVNDIAEGLLPFSSHELHLAVDQHAQELFAISKPDVAPLLKKLDKYGLDVCGIAFASSGGVQYAPFAATGESIRLPAPVRWTAVALLVVLALGGAYTWQSESRIQSALESRLTSMQTQSDGAIQSPEQTLLSDDAAADIAASLQSISIRNATQVAALMQLLARNIPPDAEIEQLIITDTEVLLDGKATAATAVQAVLEQTGKFSSSEFVSAISSSADQQTERFRLRLLLPDE